MSLRLAVVTASLDPEKTQAYWQSWAFNTHPRVNTEICVMPKGTDFARFNIEHVVETGDIVGVVPAFAAGVRKAVELGADIVACFHDDLRIDEQGWDKTLISWFEEHPRCGLVGFFGARSLGAGDIYRTPYSPMQLARGGTMQNMQDGEKHGERILVPRRAVCFDGFSQIGRGSFMVKAFARLEALGVIHHGYDSALGAMSIRDGWENWYLPISCHHAGGTTAVGNDQYQKWAKEKDSEGDQGFWRKSHAILYEELRNCLPLWVSE